MTTPNTPSERKLEELQTIEAVCTDLAKMAADGWIVAGVARDLIRRQQHVICRLFDHQPVVDEANELLSRWRDSDHAKLCQDTNAYLAKQDAARLE